MNLSKRELIKPAATERNEAKLSKRGRWKLYKEAERAK